MHLKFNIFIFTAKVLEGLEMDMDQFIDLCIILGCDYCEKIRGVGPKSAIKLIQEHKTIEKIIKNVDGKKHSVPENWIFQVEQARTLFKEPDVDKEIKPEGAFLKTLYIGTFSVVS